MNSPVQPTVEASAANRQIADRLMEHADLLQQQNGDSFRIRAYRDAARTVAEFPRPMHEVLSEGGQDALIALPTIGRGIAAAITEMLTTGRWAQHDRLRGEVSPEKIFQTIPGIGPKLAARLVDEHHIETLEDLEAAMLLGGQPIAGIGPRRRTAVAAVLAQRLDRSTLRQHPLAGAPPPLESLLRVDALYRSKAAAVTLPRIAPKRFNPTGEAWLPIFHARHDDWHFTVLFSNTALANQLGRKTDWVVVYFQKDGGTEGRCTIVTETRGALQGKRVVRGREGECMEYYSRTG